MIRVKQLRMMGLVKARDAKIIFDKGKCDVVGNVDIQTAKPAQLI